MSDPTSIREKEEAEQRDSEKVLEKTYDDLVKELVEKDK
jgi:hypothetical protein